MSLTLGYVSRTCGWTCVASVLTADKMVDRHVLTVGLIQSCLAGIKTCLFASVGDLMSQRVQDSLNEHVCNQSLFIAVDKHFRALHNLCFTLLTYISCHFIQAYAFLRLARIFIFIKYTHNESTRVFY